MQDQKHRELMAELYRIYERYEVPPERPALLSYFDQLNKELAVLWEKHKDNPVAVELIFGLLQGLSNLTDQMHGERRNADALPR